MSDKVKPWLKLADNYFFLSFGLVLISINVLLELIQLTEVYQRPPKLLFDPCDSRLVFLIQNYVFILCGLLSESESNKSISDKSKTTQFRERKNGKWGDGVRTRYGRCHAVRLGESSVDAMSRIRPVQYFTTSITGK